MTSIVNVDKMVRDVIVIGASAGGIDAVVKLLSKLPADLPAVLCIVIHRGAWSADNWSHTLGKLTTLKVVEPESGASLQQGCVYVAPSDAHMTFRRDKLVLDAGAKQHHTRPAIDPLFTSAASAYGVRVLGVVLTGDGCDGMQGLVDITNAGGLSLVQSPSEAKHASMPEHALAHDHVSAALTIDELGDALIELAHGRTFQRQAPVHDAVASTPPLVAGS